ncbi:hypothetical protein [Clostridium sp. YIM B02569]|uniref:hypothetical protein n=1 Tax=Clostridium sp. YIM B02569 TaxID=2911967 RepID=UPI001EEA8E49|nr:hypothetical protein [Clostridium sp. YIM B02569]
MKVNNVDVLVSSLEVKKNSNTKEDYISLGILTLDDGTNFTISEKDMNKLPLLKPMNKYRMNLLISSSQYGIRVSIGDIIKDLGGILGVPIQQPIEKK